MTRHRLTAAAWCAAVMAVFATILLPRLGEPRGAVWDESYYLGAAARYELGRTQFASHPPLGLMLIAAGDRAWGARDQGTLESLAASKAVRGESIPPNFDFTGMRLAPALFGVAGAGLFFLLMLALTRRTLDAALLSGLFVFQTAFIAQFRAAQLDAFQLTFVLVALLAAVMAVRRRSIALAALYGAAAGLAAMVRADALLLGAAFPFIGWQLWRTRGLAQAAAGAAAALGGLVLAIGAVFAAHLLAAPRAPDPSVPAGIADAAWVSPRLQAYYDGGTLTPQALWAGMRDYARYMDNDLRGMPKSDANGSKPWSWPLGWRPIQYRWDTADTRIAFVALVPNYPAWWLGLAGLVAALWTLARRRGPAELAMLATLWLTFLAAHLLLAEQRVLYLYNHFIPLLIGWACLARVLAAREDGAPALIERPAARAAAGLVLAAFLAIMPLALHHDVDAAGPTAAAGRALGGSLAFPAKAATGAR